MISINTLNNYALSWQKTVIRSNHSLIDRRAGACFLHLKVGAYELAKFSSFSGIGPLTFHLGHGAGPFYNDAAICPEIKLGQVFLRISCRLCARF